MYLSFTSMIPPTKSSLASYDHSHINTEDVLRYLKLLVLPNYLVLPMPNVNCDSANS